MPGVGIETEQSIWKSNILSWDELCRNPSAIKVSQGRAEHIALHLQESLAAYNSGNFGYFAEKIPLKHHWRAYGDLKDKCCFLDIETTGLDKHRDEITMIGIYNGNESKIFINGRNLDQFHKELLKYPLIVTFNGRCFDLPFIKNKFPDAKLDKLHIDLRFAMRALGYSGGLKSIERQLGIDRGDELYGVDGFEAVRLWYKYKRGDDNSLMLLKKYLKADIENLKTLMEFAYDKLKENHFLSVIS